MAQAARLSLRMQKELKLLLTDPPHGVSLLPLSDSESSSISSLSDIEARIEGPEGTVYADGVFTVRIQIPERYPFQPPNVTFVTPIYHPNIDNGGRICLDILNLPPKGAWQPSLNISTVLTSIGLLLSDPNPDDGLMCETSKEYKYNRQVFDQKARSWTERFAKAGICGSSNDSCIQPKPKKIERETGFEDPSIGNEGSRKIRVIGEKLSLKSVPVEEKSAGEKKENVKSARRLSLSLSLNVLGGSEKANTLKHEILSAEVHPRQDHCIENKENISLAPSRHLSLCQSQNVLGHMNETSTLKHKTVSSKPHLMQDDCIENKENKSLAPAKHLLPSQSQNVLGVSNKAPNLKHEISVESRLKQDDCIEISNRNEQQLEQGFNVVNTVIVLDSESDDEDDRPARSRFSLLQKLMTGNWKNGSAAKCKPQI